MHAECSSYECVCMRCCSCARWIVCLVVTGKRKGVMKSYLLLSLSLFTLHRHGFMMILIEVGMPQYSHHYRFIKVTPSPFGIFTFSLLFLHSPLFSLFACQTRQHATCHTCRKLATRMSVILVSSRFSFLLLLFTRIPLNSEH